MKKYIIIQIISKFHLKYRQIWPLEQSEKIWIWNQITKYFKQNKIPKIEINIHEIPSQKKWFNIKQSETVKNNRKSNFIY